jgi:hydrogenase-4 component B
MPLLGLSAHQSMDRIAAFCLPFFRLSPMAHAVHYFSLENLKGAAISISIGALVSMVLIVTMIPVGYCIVRNRQKETDYDEDM